MFVFFFFKQKTAYEMRISDWSSDVCSSDLALRRSRQVLDAAQCIALRITTAARSGGQIDRHAPRRARVARRIAASAANQRISTAAADQGVVAITAIKAVCASAATEHIVAGITGQAVRLR